MASIILFAAQRFAPCSAKQSLKYLERPIFSFRNLRDKFGMERNVSEHVSRLSQFIQQLNVVIRPDSFTVRRFS